MISTTWYLIHNSYVSIRGTCDHPSTWQLCIRGGIGNSGSDSSKFHLEQVCEKIDVVSPAFAIIRSPCSYWYQHHSSCHFATPILPAISPFRLSCISCCFGSQSQYQYQHHYSMQAIYNKSLVLSLKERHAHGGPGEIANLVGVDAQRRTQRTS